ncbi:putative odorant receptor 83c [Uranotaenia lowii]|uniref:putative odorant receptor 83c n=1 Tax=Uranotaenia lowii TaxID=190385 RepID=UPI002478D0E5|nr:putative odorant receptor 83c [Uranotaenia lowii]
MIFTLATYYYVNVVSAYNLRHEPEKVIFGLVTVGVGFQNFCKIYTYLTYCQQIRSMNRYQEVLLREECNLHTKELLMNNVFAIDLLRKLVFSSYPWTAIVLLITPLLLTLIGPENILPYGFFMPYLDWNTTLGYAINYVWQIWLTVMVLTFHMGPDCFYLILITNAFTQINLLKNMLERLDESVKDNANQETASKLLKRIIVRHQEHISYLSKLEETFRMNWFVTLSSSSLGLVTTLYAAVILKWYQGFAYILSITVQIGFVCILGTMLDMKNEQLQQTVYKISWYRLSNSHQKSIGFFLSVTQETKAQTLIFAPLNMPTFLQLYKTIYSIFTMLIAVKKE